MLNSSFTVAHFRSGYGLEFGCRQSFWRFLHWATDHGMRPSHETNSAPLVTTFRRHPLLIEIAHHLFPSFIGGNSKTTNEFAPSREDKPPTKIALYCPSLEIRIWKVAISRCGVKYCHRLGKICLCCADFHPPKDNGSGIAFLSCFQSIRRKLRLWYWISLPLIVMWHVFCCADRASNGNEGVNINKKNHYDLSQCQLCC